VGHTVPTICKRAAGQMNLLVGPDAARRP